MIINDKSYGIILIFRKDNHEDRFLILRHNAGHWSFPKGHKEEGETSVEAALRELEEESGIKEIEFAKDTPVIKENYSFEKNGNHYDKTNEYFIAFTKDDIVKIQNSEINEYKWATYDEAVNTFTFEEPKGVLLEVKNILNNESKK